MTCQKSRCSVWHPCNLNGDWLPVSLDWFSSARFAICCFHAKQCCLKRRSRLARAARYWYFQDCQQQTNRLKTPERDCGGGIVHGRLQAKIGVSPRTSLPKTEKRFGPAVGRAVEFL